MRITATTPLTRIANNIRIHDATFDVYMPVALKYFTIKLDLYWVVFFVESNASSMMFYFGVVYNTEKNFYQYIVFV